MFPASRFVEPVEDPNPKVHVYISPTLRPPLFYASEILPYRCRRLAMRNDMPSAKPWPIVIASAGAPDWLESLLVRTAGTSASFALVWTFLMCSSICVHRFGDADLTE